MSTISFPVPTTRTRRMFFGTSTVALTRIFQDIQGDWYAHKIKLPEDQRLARNFILIWMEDHYHLSIQVGQKPCWLRRNYPQARWRSFAVVAKESA
jgi:hypothetical protein